MPKQEPVGLLLGAAVRRIKLAVASRTAGHGLTPRQFWVLVAVLESRGPSLRQLVDRLRIDAPTASRVVGALERRRLLRTRPDPRDRRRTRIEPGAAARPMEGPLLALAAEVRSAVVAGMPRAEEAAVRAGLTRVIANMDRFDRAGPRLGAGPPPRRRGRP